jgi:hypothetical protein
MFVNVTLTVIDPIYLFKLGLLPTMVNVMLCYVNIITNKLSPKSESTYQYGSVGSAYKIH